MCCAVLYVLFVMYVLYELYIVFYVLYVLYALYGVVPGMRYTLNLLYVLGVWMCRTR